MADPREEAAVVRYALALATVAAVIGGAVGLAVREATATDASPTAIPSLPPLPALEPDDPTSSPAAVGRRPEAVATTRSSR